MTRVTCSRGGRAARALSSLTALGIRTPIGTAALLAGLAHRTTVPFASVPAIVSSASVGTGRAFIFFGELGKNHAASLGLKDTRDGDIQGLPDAPPADGWPVAGAGSATC